MKNKIIISLSLMGLFLASNVNAAKMVPKNSPLQPMPADTAPNVSNNVNSPDSQFNTNAKGQVPQIQTTPEQSNEPNGSSQTSPDQQSAVVAGTSTSSLVWYWVLFFVGVLGLIGVGVWTYIRFVRKV